jgi:biopolymer transport protein ExbD
MSASAADDSGEINLTPLLDMVLQLIMFFMMCVNFVSDQVNANVLLPTSSSAQELQSKAEGSVLVINIEVEREPVMINGQPKRDTLTGEVERQVKRDAQGRRTTRINFVGYEPIIYTEDQEGRGLHLAQKNLAQQARIYRREEAAKQRKRPEDIEVLMPVVIRADQDTRYGLVVLLMAQCVKEGFSKVELRARTKTD